MKTKFIIALTFFCFHSFAQKVCHFDHSSNKANNYILLEQKLNQPNNDYYTDNVASSIVNTVGLKENFILCKIDNYGNCSALNLNGFRVVIYDRAFIESFSYNSTTKMAAYYYILSHEIGHHLQGHTINLNTHINYYQSRKDELDADEFAGFIAAKNGIMKNVLLEIVRKIPAPKSSNGTHPSTALRIASVNRGYEKGINGNFQVSQKITQEQQKAHDLDMFWKTYKTANSLYNQGNFSLALKKTEECLKIRKEFFAQILLANCYAAQGNSYMTYSTLLDIDLSKIEDEKFKSNYIYYNLALSAFKERIFNTSLKYFEKCAKVNKDDLAAISYASAAAYNDNQYTKAVFYSDLALLRGISSWFEDAPQSRDYFYYIRFKSYIYRDLVGKTEQYFLSEEGAIKLVGVMVECCDYNVKEACEFLSKLDAGKLRR
jgi:tetratricopeptide (TPR) repeat protein